MNLNYSEEQTMLREQVLKFCETNYDFIDREKILDSDEGYSLDNWKKFAELGWLAVPFNEDNGGFNFGPIELTVLFEEFGKSLVVEPYLSSVVMSGTILENSDHTDKTSIIEKIISGEHQVSVAYAEPNIGYNFLDCVTTISTNKDTYSLNGSKSLVLNASNADQFIVLATYEDEPLLAIINADVEGLSIQSFKTLDGQICGDLTFENVSLSKAYDYAYKTDPTSAFGGIIAFNKGLDDKLLQKIISRQFVEVIIAPKVTNNGLKIMKAKPNIRLLIIDKFDPKIKSYDMKALKSNFLIQESDSKSIAKNNLNFVTKKKPSLREINDLLFAFKVTRFVKSNAIVFVKNKKTLGIGAGQMSRIDSTNIARDKAKKQKINLKGCVMASEAFFPFRDNVDLAKKIGVSSIIQPGGSIKDKEIISAVNQHKMSMVFTGIRVFKH